MTAAKDKKTTALLNTQDAQEPTQQETDVKEKQSLEKIKEFSRGLVTVQDIIAPEAVELDFDFQRLNSFYTQSMFVAGYPRTVVANWLSPLINYPANMNISMFIYPEDSDEILDNLKRRITEMEAEITSDLRAGKMSNISTEVKLEDAINLREQLARGTDRFFQLGLYITIKANSLDELDKLSKALRSSLGSLMIITKVTTMQMGAGFKTCLPLGEDKLKVTRNMDTTALATTFPFTSSELSMETGIMYGINEHNGSLVIFDRFAMPNANMVVFAQSGAGKSYTVKLEIIRQLMFGVEVLVLDPEHEYADLANQYEGQYINFTFNADTKINPFDMSNLYEEGENELGQKILSLHGLLKLMLGRLSPEQDALLDKAIVATYKGKGITPEPASQTNEPPLMEDLYKAVIGFETPAAMDIAARLEKFITGSFRGIFDQKSNIDIKNQLVIFSVHDIEEELRPLAMYVILDFIWTRIKKDLKKRILVVDEAWYFMSNQDSAQFLYSMVKRARKYYLGITTISQDVEDFLGNSYGKAIVSNSSIQFLMKQASVSLPVLTNTFYLSQGEQQLLMAAEVGEGIFFAGSNHVALRVIASEEEHEVITTNPEDVIRRQQSTETSPEVTPLPPQSNGNIFTPNSLSSSTENSPSIFSSPPASVSQETTSEAPSPSPDNSFVNLYQPPSK